MGNSWGDSRVENMPYAERPLMHPNSLDHAHFTDVSTLMLPIDRSPTSEPILSTIGYKLRAVLPFVCQEFFDELWVRLSQYPDFDPIHAHFMHEQRGFLVRLAGISREASPRLSPSSTQPRPLEIGLEFGWSLCPLPAYQTRTLPFPGIFRDHPAKRTCRPLAAAIISRHTQSHSFHNVSEIVYVCGDLSHSNVAE